MTAWQIATQSSPPAGSQVLLQPLMGPIYPYRVEGRPEIVWNPFLSLPSMRYGRLVEIATVLSRHCAGVGTTLGARSAGLCTVPHKKEVRP
jgi:hypothetical protein